MNFNKSEHFVNNKGKNVLMKKVISKKDLNGLQDLKIDKFNMYEEERTTKISNKMYQHISQKSELSHKDCIIKGKDDDQDEGPPNFEQPMVIQKKNMNTNSEYDTILSHVSGCLNNQQHDMMFGEVETGVLKSSHKVYVSDKSDIAIGGSMSEVPLKFVSMTNHHEILMSSEEDSH